MLSLDSDPAWEARLLRAPGPCRGHTVFANEEGLSAPRVSE